MFFNREATAQIDFSEVQFACCLVTQPAYKKGFLARVSRNSKSLKKSNASILMLEIGRVMLDFFWRGLCGTTV